jgi:hypothetical protein
MALSLLTCKDHPADWLISQVPTKLCNKCNYTGTALASLVQADVVAWDN